MTSRGLRIGCLAAIVLVAALSALRWRLLTRTALCRQLVSALESWAIRRRLADIELGWLLDDA